MDKETYGHGMRVDFIVRNATKPRVQANHAHLGWVLGPWLRGE
jgi:hypothetical protein